MKLALRSIVVLILVAGLFTAGVFAWRSLDATGREATASDLLMGARAELAKGNRSQAIFMAGSATGLNPSAFVLLAAGDILLEANEPNLARDVLARALSEAASTDTKLGPAIKEALDRVAQSGAKISK